MNSSQKAVLKDTSSFFQFLLQNSKISALFILDKEGTILEINKGVENSYGYSKKDLIGKNFSVLFIAEDKAKKNQKQSLAP